MGVGLVRVRRNVPACKSVATPIIAQLTTWYHIIPTYLVTNILAGDFQGPIIHYVDFSDYRYMSSHDESDNWSDSGPTESHSPLFKNKNHKSSF